MTNSNSTGQRYRDNRTVDQVIADMEGKWHDFFSEKVSELDAAMERPGVHVACPVHGGSNGFRLYRDYPAKGGGVCNTCGAKAGGVTMTAWIRGVDQKTAFKEVASWLRGEETNPAPVRRPPPKAIPKTDPRKNFQRLKETWAGTSPLKGTPAELYLMKRGIWSVNLPNTLRAHPALVYYDKVLKKITGSHPGVVAPIKNSKGLIISLHRIYVTKDGLKADVDEVKKMMGPSGELKGCAIQLFPAGKVLGFCEGIETALAVHAITRMPVWSCVAAVLMECVDIPDEVETVVIWEDLDRSGRGREAGEKLEKRALAMGKKVLRFRPEGPIPEDAKGVDWLDVMNGPLGMDGFPAEFRNWRPEMAHRAAA